MSAYKIDMDTKETNMGASAPAEGPSPDDRHPDAVAEEFGVDARTADRVIAEALSTGGDYCDLYFSSSQSSQLRLEDGTVSQAGSRMDRGLGVRVVAAEATGYAFTESLTLEAMRTAARTAARIARSAPTSSRPRPIPVTVPGSGIPDRYPIDEGWETVDMGRKVAFLTAAHDRMRSRDPRVIQASLTFADATAQVLIATSDGVWAADTRPMVRVGASCTALSDGRRESNGYNLAGRLGGEFLTDETARKLADTAVDRTVALFSAIRPEPGEMPVILAPGDAGILLHEAIGHGLEADFNRKETSVFADRLGQRVAREEVSIVDDGTLPHLRGSINIDDEGIVAERTVLVENGVLRGYLHDRISAAHYGVPPTGNGRRQSFRHAPLPRMRNTFMAAGPHDPKEIIASVKRGLYAQTFTNGQVTIGAGDFTFYVKWGYLIEDGRLTRPVKDVNVIGNGPAVLGRIEMVGNDPILSEGGWTCGKAGQMVPVSQGLPTVKVASMTVGGVRPASGKEGS
jgi:TldD protein